MPAKRSYNIKGTNDFLVLGVIFFFLCIWAIKDAWFPSDKVLKKHPLEMAVSFETAGSIDKIFVDEGDSVTEEQVIAKLRSDRMAVEYEAAKDAYTKAKNKYTMMTVAMKNAKEGASEQGLAEIQERAAVAKKTMDESLAKVTELRVAMDSTELKSPTKGKVMEVMVGAHTLVEPGDVVLKIDPKDHFYLFNKSLAIFSFFAFWIFLAIHILAR
ncbi:efflux RND transporter periplasmic adaptor subunit [Pontiellaceae bacterium B12219]|nr:efflux RND transporter periplasmic adaptor subunit [Pontiellaceae bacterium B12219]